MHVDLFHGVHDEGVDLWEETDGEYDGQTEHQNYKTGDGTSAILYKYYSAHIIDKFLRISLILLIPEVITSMNYRK